MMFFLLKSLCLLSHSTAFGNMASFRYSEWWLNRSTRWLSSSFSQSQPCRKTANSKMHRRPHHHRLIWMLGPMSRSLWPNQINESLNPLRGLIAFAWPPLDPLCTKTTPTGLFPVETCISWSAKQQRSCHASTATEKSKPGYPGNLRQRTFQLCFWSGWADWMEHQTSSTPNQEDFVDQVRLVPTSVAKQSLVAPEKVAPALNALNHKSDRNWIA